MSATNGEAANASAETGPELEGVVDGFDGGVLRGWARAPGFPDLRVDIEIHAGDICLARGKADAYRADLAAAGKGDGACAFCLQLDPLPAAGTRLVVTAVCNGRRHTLAGSPLSVADAEDTPPADTLADVFPLPIRGTHMHGSLDQCGPLLLRGWAQYTDARSDLPMLALYEGDTEILRCKAERWRSDIAERLDRDGCCGFQAELPDTLRDGRLHVLELRQVGSGETVLERAFRIRLATTVQTGPRHPPALERDSKGAAITLSVIVNFYNMQREAARTLTSLTSAYQRDIDGLDYEVLCIDNGSEPPLDADWVAGFGPSFRLIRPEKPSASPCAVINQVALEARGKYLALMIDGAHLLTPGVLSEAVAAWHEDPEAVVVLRHWFVGGDQRWLARAGYSREQENRLFERIHWPNNGYELFRIGTPIDEYPDHWFDSLSESNCLMLPTTLFDRIGGFDPAFSGAGGEFANLDLWRRVSDAAPGNLVSLLGEASFHQFHAGTTTNVHDEEKDLRVRRYARFYRQLRGCDFEGVHHSRLRFRGSIRADRAIGIRQRPLLPMDLDVTTQVRRGRLEKHLDEGARQYLQSTYAECGLAREVTWLGQATGVAPADMNALQQIVHEQRPDAVVAAGVAPGLVRFLADVLGAAGTIAPILEIGPNRGAPAHPRAQLLCGAAHDRQMTAAARQWLGGAENVLVLLACPATASLDGEILEDWSTLVSLRSWLIVTGTVYGQPWLGYAAQRHRRVIQDFVAREDVAFVIEHLADRQWLSTCPDGFLRRVGGYLAATDYDASLDQPLPAMDIAGEQAA